MTKGGHGVTGATSIEARLSGVVKAYTENKGHFAKVTFEVAALDLESSRGIWEAPLGSRFALAMAEIDVDETPLVRPKTKGKKKFHELGATTQAGIRCGEGAFHKFLAECYPETWKRNEPETDAPVRPPDMIAARVVRQICNVESRADLNLSPLASKIWHDMNSQFLGWMEVG